MNKLYMNGQEITLKKPTTDDLEDFFIVSRDMSSKEAQANPKESFRHMTPEGRKALISMINRTLNRSFVDYERREEEIKEWGMSNFGDILMHILTSVQPPKTKDQAKREEMHKQIDEMEKQVKDATTKTTEKTGQT